jgi:hypothetical protein
VSWRSDLFQHAREQKRLRFSLAMKLIPQHPQPRTGRGGPFFGGMFCPVAVNAAPAHR